MAARVSTQTTPYGKDVKVRMDEKKPEKKDYYLSGIEMDPASNGLIVTCRWSIKPEVRDAMRKKEQYCDTYREPEKHVFESRAEAAKFIQEELVELEVPGSVPDDAA